MGSRILPEDKWIKTTQLEDSSTGLLVLSVLRLHFYDQHSLLVCTKKGSLPLHGVSIYGKFFLKSILYELKSLFSISYSSFLLLLHWGASIFNYKSLKSLCFSNVFLLILIQALEPILRHILWISIGVFIDWHDGTHLQASLSGGWDYKTRSSRINTEFKFRLIDIAITCLKTKQKIRTATKDKPKGA